jgi:hypothetical protein
MAGNDHKAARGQCPGFYKIPAFDILIRNLFLIFHVVAKFVGESLTGPPGKDCLFQRLLFASESFSDFHSHTHIAVDFQFSGHEGHHRIQVAVKQFQCIFSGNFEGAISLRILIGNRIRHVFPVHKDTAFFRLKFGCCAKAAIGPRIFLMRSVRI